VSNVTPYALVQVVVNGGSPYQGGFVGAGIQVPAGATIALSGVNVTGWETALWEIYDWPAGWSAPSGWTLQASGVISYAGSNVSPNPPTFTLPSISLWGKFPIRLTVNSGLDGTGKYNPSQMIDASMALSMLSTNGLRDGFAGEGPQFATTLPYEAYQQDVKANWRTIDAFMSAFVGFKNGVVQKSASFAAVANTYYLIDCSGGAVTMTLPVLTANQVIGFSDWKSACATHNITVTPQSGKQLMSPATLAYLSAGTSFVANINGVSASWIYDGTLLLPVYG
jgi:hypothetical protein